jgi:hypothetical protein
MKSWRNEDRLWAERNESFGYQRPVPGLSATDELEMAQANDSSNKNEDHGGSVSCFTLCVNIHFR